MCVSEVLSCAVLPPYVTFPRRNTPCSIHRQDIQAAHRTGDNRIPFIKRTLSEDLVPYWKVRDQLTLDGNLVLYGAHILVPQTLRRQVLTRLHDSHRGVEATKRRARQTVWWPNINNDITNVVRSCEACQIMLPSQQ